MNGRQIVAGVGIGNWLDTPQRTILELSNPNNIMISENAEGTVRDFKQNGISVTKKQYTYLPHFENGVHVNASEIDSFVKMIENGETLVLVSSEGMPLIHDPGYELVKKVRERNLPITVIPGPCAVTAALNVSGIDSWKYLFESDIPTNKEERLEIFEELKNRNKTTVFFEKDFNLLDSITDLANILESSRPVSLCIDMTSVKEKIIRCTIQELLNWCSNNDFLGKSEEEVKMVLVVCGSGYYKPAEINK